MTDTATLESPQTHEPQEPTGTNGQAQGASDAQLTRAEAKKAKMGSVLA